MNKAPAVHFATFQTGTTIAGIPQYTTHILEENSSIFKHHTTLKIKALEHSSGHCRLINPRKY